MLPTSPYLFLFSFLFAFFFFWHKMLRGAMITNIVKISVQSCLFQCIFMYLPCELCKKNVRNQITGITLQDIKAALFLP